MDVEKLVEESQSELAEYANKRIPLPQKDLNKKDLDLLSKVNLVAQAVKVDEPPLLGVDINEQWTIEDTLRKELPSEKRLMVDDIYKVLYFNNADPELYNVQFWADYFKISAASIRNIFNYLAFPVTNPETKQVDSVLYFIDADLQVEELKKLLPEGQQVDRHMYLQYLEKEYGKRMLAEHGEEQGFFGQVDPLSLMP
jgi:hypothetical protein